MEKLIKHDNGQWSLVKSEEEPSEYKLPSGAVIKRSFRGQHANSAEDQYDDNWTLHDEHGLHLGNATVNHGLGRRPEIGIEPGGNFGEWPSTMKKLPNGNADKESYDHHNFMANQYAPEIINQLASHYGEISTPNNFDPEKVDPKHKYSSSHQTRAEMHNWKPKEYHGSDPDVLKYLADNHARWASQPKETWHHVKASNDSKVNYEKARNEDASGGLYEVNTPNEPTIGSRASLKGAVPFKPKQNKTKLN